MLMLEARRIFNPAEFIDANIRFPLYDGDLEVAEGIPPVVQVLADQIATADAIIIVGPEYNKAMSGVLKNALDWISRTKGAPWRDKPVAILSAAAGRAGGERTQMTLRHAMTPFRPHLLTGPEMFVGGASGEFDENGHLTNTRGITLLEELMAELRKAAGLTSA